MLRQLYIKNFALIDELDMEFRQGFSVITGETGAGKSIILGAIGLLLGQRADSKTVKMGADKCVIEAHFDLSRYDMADFFEQNEIEYDAQDTIVRRELTAAGKSRAFINDTPVQLALLKELGERLVDVHSQHQNLLLNTQDFQLSVVDIIAGDQAALDDYKTVFMRYQDTARRLERLKNDIEQNRQQVPLEKQVVYSRRIGHVKLEKVRQIRVGKHRVGVRQRQLEHLLRRLLTQKHHHRRLIKRDARRRDQGRCSCAHAQIRHRKNKCYQRMTDLSFRRILV